MNILGSKKHYDVMCLAVKTKLKKLLVGKMKIV